MTLMGNYSLVELHLHSIKQMDVTVTSCLEDATFCFNVKPNHQACRYQVNHYWLFDIDIPNSLSSRALFYIVMIMTS